MNLLNILRAIIAYKKDKKRFPETINRNIIDLHVRQDFKDIPKVILKHYSKKRKFLIITGKTHTKKFGEEIVKIMRESKFKVNLKSVKVKIPSIELAKEIAKDNNYVVPIGVGGGSILDLAKLVGHEVGNKPISIPTTLATDSMASPIVSYLKENIRTSKAVLRPSPIYVNINIVNVPRLTLSGIGEAMSNYTALRDWRNSAYFYSKRKVRYSKLFSLTGSIIYGYWLSRELRSEKEINNDVLDLIISSHFFSGLLMEIAGSSAPCSGAEHLLSHAVDELFPEKKSLHGEQVGVFTTVVACLQSKWFRKYGILSRNAVRIRKTLENIGAKSTLSDLGLNLSEENLHQLFNLAKKRGKQKNRYNVLNYVSYSDFYSAIVKTKVWEEY